MRVRQGMYCGGGLESPRMRYDWGRGAVETTASKRSPLTRYEWSMGSMREISVAERTSRSGLRSRARRLLPSRWYQRGSPGMGVPSGEVMGALMERRASPQAWWTVEEKSGLRMVKYWAPWSMRRPSTVRLVAQRPPRPRDFSKRTAGMRNSCWRREAQATAARPVPMTAMRGVGMRGERMAGRGGRWKLREVRDCRYCGEGRQGRWERDAGDDDCGDG